MKRSNLYLFIGFMLFVIPNAVASGVIDPTGDVAKVVILLSTSLTMYLQKLGIDLAPSNKATAEEIRAAVRKELEEPGKPAEEK